MWKPARVLLVLSSLALALCAILLSGRVFTISDTLHKSSTDMSSAASNLLNVSRNVVKKVYAVETPEGVGATVRRTIGTPNLQNLSPFLMYVLSLLRCKLQVLKLSEMSQAR